MASHQVQTLLAQHLAPFQAEINALRHANQAIQAELVRVQSEAAASTSQAPKVGEHELPRAYKAPSLDTYSGDRRENLRAWLFQVEEHLSLLHVTEDVQKITMAGLALRKAAKTWYQAVYEERKARLPAPTLGRVTGLFQPCGPCASGSGPDCRAKTGDQCAGVHGTLPTAVHTHPKDG